jgi:hypothetical protein
MRKQDYLENVNEAVERFRDELPPMRASQRVGCETAFFKALAEYINADSAELRRRLADTEWRRA